jgi:large subunit ribosomal protein L24
MKLRTDDNVLVVKGRDRGKQGRIQRVLTADSKVMVEGVNVVMRHTKASPNLRQAGIIQKELPIHAANVALICTQCSRPTRVSFRVLPDGTKARVCLKCEEVIE